MQADNFLTNKFSFGLIIRANLETIEDIKQYISYRRIRENGGK